MLANGFSQVPATGLHLQLPGDLPWAQVKDRARLRQAANRNAVCHFL